MAGEERALLVYDGDCASCNLWVDHWRTLTGERVQYTSSQEIAEKFPDVPREKYARAVQLIDADGSRLEGAAAVFALHAKRPGFGWMKKLYEAPAVAPVSEWVYRLVARHRPFFLKLTHLLWGKKLETPRYGLTSRLFLQALSAIYFFAFISLLSQLPGLVGEQGLLPAQTSLAAARAEHGFAAVWLAPTFAWFGAHTGALQFMALLGTLAALLAFGGILLAPCLALMWALYLSLVVIGQSFAGFQWDLLLLEAGFLAIFLVPFRRAVSYRSRLETSGTVLWLYRFLLFRLLLASGFMRFFPEGAGWFNLSFLSSYFETQPLPTTIAWFAHQVPVGVLSVLALFLCVFELLVPFLFFLPSRARRLGALLMAGYQLFWLLTGNFAFLHLLALVLCLPLLDDALIERVLPRLRAKHPFVPARDGVWRRRLITTLAVALVTLGLTRLFAIFTRVPAPALLLTAVIAPLRVSNDYGFFGVTTAARQEVIIEGSTDGVVWKEYGFVQKPGDPKRAPGWAMVFQSRLDWRMWSAARSEPTTYPWVAHLMIRLLQGSEPVLALFEENPFPQSPPKYVRATLYAYRFTTPEERARDGAWWRREMKSSYLPTLSLGAQPGGAP
ncbi:MAG: lipase maturation factor family protein [Patescibacteria group bacterium]|jgi:predicted DCC family thiol-disulfide oxidoreductase YuxK